LKISLKNSFILLANISPMYNLVHVPLAAGQAQDLIF